MKLNLSFTRTALPGLCLLAVICLSGCVPDQDYAKAVDQFRTSSTALTSSYRSLLLNANAAEEENYIDTQVFAAQPLDPASIQARDLLTPAEIRLRISAMQALADYTLALATLAEGRPSAEIEASTKKASASLGSLTTDAAAAITHPASTTTAPDYAGPVSGAVSAIGEVIALIEKHRGQSELRASLAQNDPHVKALFDLIGKESTELYERRQATLGNTGVILFHLYDTLRQRQPPDSATLLQLGDRIRQYRSDTALLASADPSASIAAFQRSHDALVAAILAPRESRRESLAQLLAAIGDLARQTQTATTPAASTGPA